MTVRRLAVGAIVTSVAGPAMSAGEAASPPTADLGKGVCT